MSLWGFLFIVSCRLQMKPILPKRCFPASLLQMQVLPPHLPALKQRMQIYLPKPYATPWLWGYAPRLNLLIHLHALCWIHPSPPAPTSAMGHSVLQALLVWLQGGTGSSRVQTQPLSSAINQLLTFLSVRTAVRWSKAYLPSLLGFFREA